MEYLSKQVNTFTKLKLISKRISNKDEMKFNAKINCTEMGKISNWKDSH
jgi:hypothetical protein